MRPTGTDWPVRFNTEAGRAALPGELLVEGACVEEAPIEEAPIDELGVDESRVRKVESVNRSDRNETCTAPAVAGGRSHQSGARRCSIRVAGQRKLVTVDADVGVDAEVEVGNWLAKVETGEVVERAFVSMNTCSPNERSLSRNFPNRCLPFCFRAGMFIPPNSRSTPERVTNFRPLDHKHEV